MKIQLKNKTIDNVNVTLPETPSEFADRVMEEQEAREIRQSRIVELSKKSNVARVLAASPAAITEQLTPATAVMADSGQELPSLDDPATNEELKELEGLLDEEVQDEEASKGPFTHPDIIINQKLEVEASSNDEAQQEAFRQAVELVSYFANPKDYEPLVISDDDGSNERTFSQVVLGSWQYTQPQFVWNEDGHGGLAEPSYNYFVDIYLRGIEEE